MATWLEFVRSRDSNNRQTLVRRQTFAALLPVPSDIRTMFFVAVRPLLEVLRGLARLFRLLARHVAASTMTARKANSLGICFFRARALGRSR